MFVYIFTFLVITFLTFIHYQFNFSKKASFFWKSLIFIILLIFIGLRYEVGGDWFAYLKWYENIRSRGLSFSLESIILSDWGYNFLNWLSSKLQTGIYGVNTICAIIFLSALFSFLNHLGNDKDFYLGLLISYPYLIMVVANGYTRQSVAVGLVFLGYVQLLNEKALRAIVLQILAFLFHKTSAIGFVVFLFRKQSIKLIVPLSFAFILFGTYFEKLFLRYYTFYMESGMISEGGTIRAFMNILPALLLIVFYSEYKKQYKDGHFWFAFSIIVLLLGSLSIFKFTFADRLLLYFSVIQMLVLVRLNHLFKDIEWKAILFLVVIFTYTAAMFVWLLFAVHAPSWIPYGNVLLNMIL